jgi:hypothetical protein
MTAPRTQEIAATAGELHQLLTGVTPEWTDYLRGRLNPKDLMNVVRLPPAFGPP